MRCEDCRHLIRTSYEYGEYECSLGIPESDCYEDDEGYLCCKVNDSTKRKLQRKIDEYWYIKGLTCTMFALKEENAELYHVCVDYAKHAIGLDYHKPYKRHGKKFYRPYRNYYDTGECDYSVWELMCNVGFAKHGEEKYRHWYFLTRYGLDWLELELGVKIYDEEN